MGISRKADGCFRCQKNAYISALSATDRHREQSSDYARVAISRFWLEGRTQIERIPDYRFLAFAATSTREISYGSRIVRTTEYKPPASGHVRRKWLNSSFRRPPA